MARKPLRLNVVITPQAQRDINQIWDYNCDTYGPDHADGYIDFLDKQTTKLKTEGHKGKVVPFRPDHRFIVMLKGRTRGYGHIAVYQILGDTVEVLHYFHTAQDWQSKL